MNELAALISFDDGWSNQQRLGDLLAECNVREIAKGARHNHTDGEAHLIYLRMPEGETFELHANFYDGPSFVPVLKWAKRI